MSRSRRNRRNKNKGSNRKFVDYNQPRYQRWMDENEPRQNKKNKARERVYDNFGDVNRPWQDVRDEEIDGSDELELLKEVRHKTPGQEIVLNTIDDNEFTYILGEAGSGKTHLAIGKALEALVNGDVERVILIRPIVGVGTRKSGYLPGDIESKMHPFLVPLYDEAKKFIDRKVLDKLKKDEKVEILPLEYIRGRTLDNAFVIVDEAQNATYEEMKVVVTRMGENSVFVVEGDPSQSDLPKEEQGALLDYAHRFPDIDGIATCRLSKLDIVRHPLVAKMIDRGLDREQAA